MPGDEYTAVGKHLLFWVPDFSADTFAPDDSNRRMTSFLRLGAANRDWQNEPGADLLAHLPEAGPPGDPRLDDAKSKDPTVVGNRDVIFIDDVRERVPGDGHDMDAAARQAESAKLHTRGGWRDHSDGNRISTTYGDKVEVVRGNYKMVVMGRQDDPGGAMGWDAAGSHIHDFAPGTMPGASVYQEFVEDYTFADVDGESSTGVWLLVNSTENVWEYARNAGNFREENWGDLRESYTGSENPKTISTSATDGMQGHPQDDTEHSYGASDKSARPPIFATGTGLVRSNPHILEKTWATKIETYSGSTNWRIPEIYDETWAEKTEEKVDVLNTVTSTTTVGGAVTETTTVGGALTSTTTVGGASTSIDTAGALRFEKTGTAGVAIGLTNASVILEEQACAFHGEFYLAGLHLAIEVGFAIEIGLAGKLEIQLAPHKEIDVWEKDEITPLKNRIAATENDLTVTKKALALHETDLSTQKTQINTLYNVQAGTVFLG